MKNKNKKKCVLQVLPALNSGGVERGTLEISEALVKKGWRSIVMSSGGYLEQRLIRRGAEHIKLPTHTKNPFRWPFLMSKMREYFLDINPDIVHIRSRVPAWTAGRVARNLGIPVISTVHGRFIASSPLKRLYNSALLNADAIIAISKYVSDNIVNLKPSAEKLIKIIHRGADIEIFNPATISESRIIQMSSDMQLPDESQIIMMPARPTKWKGHSKLIEAFSKLSTKNAFCVMPGSNDNSSYVEYLRKLAKKFNVSGRVLFLPFLDDLPAAYMLADVVVVSSLSPEPFGRVAVEAQAMGKPVVAFSHGEVAESVLDGVTGKLVKPVYSDDLSEAINYYLNLTPSKRLKLAKIARSHIINNFSSKQMIDKTIQLYEKTLLKFKNNA